jgi:sulfite dehydrogenase (quinone) subunit SoeB
VRYAMMIDLERCVGCAACVTACVEQWDSGEGAARCWVHTLEHGARGQDLGLTFYPGQCMQCEDHPCTADCPTGATFMDDRGVVVVEPGVCVGCGNCVSTCVYGARSYDAGKQIIEKCDLCGPFVARGELPACVSTCLASCRHFGDLDDADGELARRVRAQGARPLITSEIDVRPKVTYAGDAQRARLLERPGLMTPPRVSWLTRTWDGFTRPLARYVVPAAAGVAMLGGLVVNLGSRRAAVQAAEGHEAPVAPGGPLPRHRLGVRLLHWWNALSWLVLLLTGTALLSAERFALFGPELPRVARALLGGGVGLMTVHVVWGLAWAAIIVPVFLLGLSRRPLPSQDKYNVGQKLFAISALAGTAAIIATGLVMTLHLGSPAVVAAAIVVHKLAIALALLGLAVHVTMAAILRQERPALVSMLTGRVDRAHASSHYREWADERIEEEARHED